MLQWIFSILLLLPTYVWREPVYSFYPRDYFCGILYGNLGGLFYAVSNIFFVPLILLTIIYARLLYFILYQTPHLSQTQQDQRAQRDLLIIRRIHFTVGILTLPGLLNACFVAMANINKSYSGDFYMYRIQWLGPSFIVFIFSIALGFITPKLGQIFRRVITRGNTIAPIS